MVLYRIIQYFKVYFVLYPACKWENKLTSTYKVIFVSGLIRDIVFYSVRDLSVHTLLYNYIT